MKNHICSTAATLFSLLFVVSTVALADDVRPASRAMCASITSADVAEVIGGKPDAGEVSYDSPTTGIGCVFVDESNYYNGLSLDFHTSADLLAEGGRWTTAAAYFEEFTRGGQKVTGLGDAAAWVDTMYIALFALRGETVVRITADKKTIADPTARARYETLMGKVIARLP